MSSHRRIAVVTGTRAEFGLLEPVLRALAGRKGLESRLIVTGMHLLPKFGRTIDHIRSAGWRVDAAVPMQSGRDDARAEPAALARGIEGIARALKRFNSEIVVVLGDRIEAFAGASAALAGRRVLAHIHGGDRATGDIDDALRNAITRLAHVHLAASRDAVERLRRMGEERFRIHQVGAPGLDDIRRFREELRAGVRDCSGRPPCRPFPAMKQPAPRAAATRPDGRGDRGREGIPARSGARKDSRTSISPRISIGSPTGDSHASNEGCTSIEPGRPYALIVQHPTGRSAEREAATMRNILAAVEAEGLAGAMIYPNSDPGHEGILQAIRAWKRRPGWRCFRSLPRADYLQIAFEAAVMVGNSSSGIIESGSLGVNAVNVGDRQQGRLRCGPGVIDCGESLPAIRRAVRLALSRPRPRPGRSVYGDGRAGERIADVLEGLIINPRLLRKRLAF